MQGVMGMVDLIFRDVPHWWRRKPLILKKKDLFQVSIRVQRWTP